MLRVTIESVPYGTGEKKTIATAHISNDGTGDIKHGSYTAVFYNNRGVMEAHSTSLIHDREDSAWDLLQQALNQRIYAKESKHNDSTR